MNILKTSMIVVLFALSLSACQKEIIEQSSSKGVVYIEVESGNEVDMNLVTQKSSSLRIFVKVHQFDHTTGTLSDEFDYACMREGGNCLPTVTVTPNDNNIISTINDIIATGDDNDVISALTTNYNTIVNYISPNLINGVISENLTIDYFEGVQNEHFYNFIDVSTGSSVNVHPIVIN